MTLWTHDDPVLVQLVNADDARARVRAVHESGVDLVKVGFAPAPGHELAAFTPILEALVEEAHARGLRVAMHAEQLEVAKLAVRSGVDVLAHTIVDRPVDDELIGLARDAGTVSITGLAHFERYQQVLDQSVSLLPIEERCGDPDVVASWDELGEFREDDRPLVPEVIRYGASAEARRILLGNVRRLFEAGVPIAAGSNGGNIGTLQGPSFHREFHMMAEAGLPPSAVLVSATRDAARALGVGDSRGTVEVGKAGDLLVLSKDPLESVENLAAIETVYVNGERVWPLDNLSRGSGRGRAVSEAKREGEGTFSSQ
jgi:imidazolonepropionase-like amidohydrolase